MRTTVSSKGQIVLPADMRAQDHIEAGQQFEIERVQAGEYLLRKVKPAGVPGLLAWLRKCPEHDWFRPLPTESTNDLRPPVEP